jgi:hypothetical protein
LEKKQGRREKRASAPPATGSAAAFRPAKRVFAAPPTMKITNESATAAQRAI